MATVDPFVIPIPRKFSNDPELKPYFNYLHKFLHDIRNRTGGGGDTINNISIRESYPWPQEAFDYEEGQEIAALYSSPQAEIKTYNNVIATSNYTAVPWDFVVAKMGVKITFPEQPGRNDVIIVRNGDGSTISLDGNGKKINGYKTGRLVREGTAIEFHYFIDTDEWYAR